MKHILVVCLMLVGCLVKAQMPTFPEMAGWKHDGALQEFNKENLFEHIDGASEFYLTYGFEKLYVASWSNKGAEVTIEVYDHADDLHAYGIYSIEKSAKASVVAVGLEGYGDATTFNFVAGRYYVKMNGTGLDKLPGFSLQGIAAEMAPKLCAKPLYPTLVGMFPKDGQVANSCQYIPTEFMGLGFLGSAVRAKYNVSGEEVTLFVMERAEKGEIAQMVQKYIDYAEAKIKKPAEGDFLLKDPFNGTVLLRWKGNHLIGVSGFSDKKRVTPLLDLFSSRM
ncbi:MAG: hypothetical protein LWW85_00405 [Marinilabiliales bacterium]|nr:hypothetical protein [Marinilabiliales bacterium]